MESTTQRQQWPAVRQQRSATALAQHGQAHIFHHASRGFPRRKGG
ncbi:hypothetical protein [Pantoea sp. KPR_PJ]